MQPRLLACALYAAVVPAAPCLAPAVVQAQDRASVVGAYCLTGVHEVGSCLKLSADGTFEYFLAYGAYDEVSQGKWRFVGGAVILDSLAYDRRPTFSFKRMQASTDDAFDIIVESKAGRAITGIDVRATCDGRSIRVGVTNAGGYKVDCVRAPADVSLGLEMFGLAYQTIDVAARAGADKVYVFEFDPGDLGKKRFRAHRLRPSANGGLAMTYADTPIRELSGRAFQYVRQ